ARARCVVEIRACREPGAARDRLEPGPPRDEAAQQDRRERQMAREHRGDARERLVDLEVKTGLAPDVELDRVPSIHHIWSVYNLISRMPIIYEGNLIGATHSRGHGRCEGRARVRGLLPRVGLWLAFSSVCAARAPPAVRPPSADAAGDVVVHAG